MNVVEIRVVSYQHPVTLATIGTGLQYRLRPWDEVTKTFGEFDDWVAIGTPMPEGIPFTVDS